MNPRTRRTLTWIAIAIATVALWRSLAPIDETQVAIVTQFGRPVATITAPGLHWILPHRSVTRFDRRLQLYAPRPSEFLTRDPKNILLDVYVCWKIADPLAFLQRVADRPGAEARLHDIVWAELAAEIGRRQLAELVSDEPGTMVTPAIMETITGRCQQRTSEPLGIEIVDVRLRRINLPEQNKQSVFDRMRAERDRIARQYRAEGEEEAMKIRADADRQKTELLADAQKLAEQKRGEAAKRAIEIYAAAHAKDPEFYRFLRSLEVYQKILGERSTLVLSSDSDLFRYLASPRADTPPKSKPAAR